MTSPSPAVTSWKQFAYRVRARRETLLAELGRFPDAILVTGCQRSGGTMLSRLLTGSHGLTNFWFSRDEELDAAQILSGVVDYRGTGRHCFQTTYLNEQWREYLHPGLDFRMVWSLRNPASVVYSMVYNWKRFALNELFNAVGIGCMDAADRIRFLRWGRWGVPPLRRAAYAYCGKVSQLVALQRQLPPQRLVVLEYDELVRDKQQLLPELYRRLDVHWDARYLAAVSERSLGKKDRLTPAERAEIDRICLSTYDAALKLVNLRVAAA